MLLLMKTENFWLSESEVIFWNVLFTKYSNRDSFCQLKFQETFRKSWSLSVQIKDWLTAPSRTPRFPLCFLHNHFSHMYCSALWIQMIIMFIFFFVFFLSKLFSSWEIYESADWVVRVIISGECFIRVLQNSMFGLLQLLEYIKTVWCVPISTL